MSLPSIREMFPEIMTTQPPSQSQSQSQSSYTFPSPTPRTRPIQHLPVYSSLPSPPPSRASPQQVPSPNPSFAFTVLRTDPHTCSLEHIASSTTLRPRLSLHSHSPSQYQSISHHVANGSQPAFRVAVPAPASAPPSGPSSSLQNSQRDDLRRASISEGVLPSNANHGAHKSNPRSGSSSSIISFSLADPPGRASTITSSDGRRTRSHHHFTSGTGAVDGIRIVDSEGRDSRDGRGKKHQCPHCSKRFNRPSSLKIHVNTHTGAKPYPCPFPGCGREFNVNSNMRRHWRNHSRNGAGPNGNISASNRPAPLQSLSALGSQPASSANLSPASAPSSLSSPSSSALSSFSPASSATSLPSAMSSPGAKSMHLHPSSGSYAPSSRHGNGASAVLVSPPLSNLSINEPEHDEDDEMSDGSEGMDVDDPSEEDELDDESGDDSPLSRAHHHRASAHGFVSESNVRSSRPSSYSTSSHSSSPYARASLAHLSPSHKATEPHQLYRPSIPAYARSCTDERVSTALRPAFAGRV